MGSTVNMGSIMRKIKSYMKSPSGKAAAAVAGEEQALEAASQAGSQLASCIESAISASGLSGGAVAAVGSVSASGASKTGDTSFEVTISIDQQSRPSLAPEKYGGVDNMAVLLNNGYAAGGRVYGEWHGSYIGSRVSLGGAHFVQQGVANFEGSYGGPCIIAGIDTGEFS